jgi:two-component system LytT family response regulator
VERIRADAPDLVLLDVQMPELDGIDVVRAIGAERMPPVVFVTAYDQHALAAFEVHALDYILKPVNRARFNRAIDRVVKLVRAPARRDTAPLAQLVEELAGTRGGSDRLAVKVADRVLYLKLSDVDWVEAADDLVRIHAGRHVYEHRTTLSQLEQRLPAKLFLRIHRSTIVNTERIREFQPWFQGDWILVLADGTRLQSGKSYRAKIRELIEG